MSDSVKVVIFFDISVNLYIYLDKYL
jgi:hypothetical protein